MHYVSHGTPVRADGTQAHASRCRAATITEVGAWIEVAAFNPRVYGDDVERTLTQRWDPTALALHVHNPAGSFFDAAVPYDGGRDGEDDTLCGGHAYDGGTWHWPEHV